MYLLQVKRIFLKKLEVIPLKCNHQEGQGFGLPDSVGGQNRKFCNCQLTDTAGLITFILTNLLLFLT